MSCVPWGPYGPRGRLLQGVGEVKRKPNSNSAFKTVHSWHLGFLYSGWPRYASHTSTLLFTLLDQRITCALSYDCSTGPVPFSVFLNRFHYPSKIPDRIQRNVDVQIVFHHVEKRCTQQGRWFVSFIVRLQAFTAGIYSRFHFERKNVQAGLNDEIDLSLAAFAFPVKQFILRGNTITHQMLDDIILHKGAVECSEKFVTANKGIRGDTGLCGQQPGIQ